MSCAEDGALAYALATVQAHPLWAYPALFLGACLETLVPLSLVVPGELVFLCGATLAGTGALKLRGVLAALYGGGLLGDNGSYWIGRCYGTGLWQQLERSRWLRPLVRPDSYPRGVEFFRRRGAWAVFAARLSGPLSWIVPALAGSLQLDYATFVRFNTPAVLIGISEFVLAGYYLGAHVAALCIGLPGEAAAAAALLTLAAVLLVRRRPRPCAPPAVTLAPSAAGTVDRRGASDPAEQRLSGP